jgi:hypothetical protein
VVSDERTAGRRYLTRYWIRLESGRHGVRDFGVTASDRDDALRMLMRDVVEPDETFRLIDVEEDVDLATLDPAVVLPNLGDPALRGIWYPLERS